MYGIQPGYGPVNPRIRHPARSEHPSTAAFVFEKQPVYVMSSMPDNLARTKQDTVRKFYSKGTLKHSSSPDELLEELDK